MAFPTWLMLEPFVFRRDDDSSFPDATKAPIRASGTTSWGALFRIAFTVPAPPRISRLYAQLPVPGFPDPTVGDPLAILATHRHLALFRVATETPTEYTVQNFFIYNSAAAAGEKLKALPPCTEPYFDYMRSDYHLPRDPPSGKPRLLIVDSMGLWCRHKEEEFIVAELTLYEASDSKILAHICLLRSSFTTPAGPDGDDKLCGTWESKRVDIMYNPDDDDAWQLCCWETDTIIPFREWLCCIDYYRGILFCDLSQEHSTPTVSFLRLPLDEFPTTNVRAYTSRFSYRGVSIVNHGRDEEELKFVNVTRHDGISFGALKSGTGFTITCHTLVLSNGMAMAWKEDYTVTSGELWDANSLEQLPRDILMFPQVDIDRPHVVHFLYMEFKYALKKMWVVSIDMRTKTVESFSPYIKGIEGLEPEDAELFREKSEAPTPFLPCEFPKFLSVSRKRRDME